MDIVPLDPYERLAPFRASPEKRLNTFKGKWSKDAPVTAQDLVDDKFYYLGYNDNVQCCHCGLTVNGWKPGDNVHLVHKRFQPRCEWISSCEEEECILPPNVSNMRGFDVGQKMEDGTFLNLRYQSVPHYAVNHMTNREYYDDDMRLGTYRGWEQAGYEHTKPSKEALAEAGFFWMGQDDLVKCFFCGIYVWEWAVDDLPWVEHAKYNPKCGWVLSNKGPEFVEITKKIYTVTMPQDEEEEDKKKPEDSYPPPPSNPTISYPH